ncbi:MAG: hypothetical protein EB120_01270, partial [Proteobacteria bacterium]|nr:hypothetical protein [Pseudomonadota bacterium]
VKISRCDFRQGLELMMRLTCAHDIEWLVLESKCTQWPEVDAILKRVPWRELLAQPKELVHVTADSFNGFTNLSSKLRENLCRAAQVEHVSEGASLRFKIELRDDQLRISVSLAGEPLYKRGYKAQMSAVAPLPEHHAAACVRWTLAAQNAPKSFEQVFIPFAGSGTLGFESLLVLSGSGPGAFQRTFACELFPCTPQATVGFLKRKIGDQLKSFEAPQIIFNELNPEAMAILRQNASQFSSPDQYQFLEGDLFDLKNSLQPSKTTLILLNPPFGNRLGKQTLMTEFYSRLGKFLTTIIERCQVTGIAGCLCPDESTWRSLTHEIKSANLATHHFTHGGKEMRLVRWTF